MELPIVRFATDTLDADLLETALQQAAGDPSIRESEVVEGFGNGLDIKVVLEQADGEDAAHDAVLRSLPEGVRLEQPPAPSAGDAFPG